MFEIIKKIFSSSYLLNRYVFVNKLNVKRLNLVKFPENLLRNKENLKKVAALIFSHLYVCIRKFWLTLYFIKTIAQKCRKW